MRQITLHGYTNAGEEVTVSLLIAVPCGLCLGDKMVQSEAWREWFERHHDDLSRPEPLGDEPNEPEERLCPNCEGSGEVLTEQGRNFLEAIRG